MSLPHLQFLCKIYQIANLTMSEVKACCLWNQTWVKFHFHSSKCLYSVSPYYNSTTHNSEVVLLVSLSLNGAQEADLTMSEVKACCLWNQTWAKFHFYSANCLSLTTTHSVPSILSVSAILNIQCSKCHICLLPTYNTQLNSTSILPSVSSVSPLLQQHSVPNILNVSPLITEHTVFQVS